MARAKFWHAFALPLVVGGLFCRGATAFGFMMQQDSIGAVKVAVPSFQQAQTEVDIVVTDGKVLGIKPSHIQKQPASHDEHRSGDDPANNPGNDPFNAMQGYQDAAPDGIDARWPSMTAL